MNASLNWFLEYGMKNHDARTTQNVLDAGFVAHAKSTALPDECEYVDQCIVYQNKPAGIQGD